MELYILAASMLFQLGAIVVAGLIAWTTLRRSWILIAFAILLMLVRCGISFYQVLLLGKSIDPIAESVALLISLFMLGGVIGLFLRERSLLAVPGARVPPLNFREPGTIAALLGVVIVMGSSIVAYYSFTTSRDALIQDRFSVNLTIARLLSKVADSPNSERSPSERISLVEAIWDAVQPRYAGSYLCLVNSNGELVVHTGDRSRERLYVGDTPIEDSAQRFSSIDGLLDAKADWVGWYHSGRGENQIAAFAYSEALSSLVAIHVPKKAVERDILLGTLPLGLGLVIILAILLPAALGVLYRAYTMALRDVQASEEKFSRVFYAHPTPMSIFGLESGDRIDFNDSFCQMIGYSRDELLNTSIFSRSLWADHADQKATFERLKVDGSIYNHPLEIVTKSGGLRSGLGTAVVLRIDGRNLVVSAIVDITELKMAQAEKSEQDTRSTAIIENALDGIITTDEKGIIESVNPAAETLFGYTRAELIGQNIRMLMPEPYRREHDGYIGRYLKEGTPRILNTSRELPGQRKDGSTFPLKLSVSEACFGERRLFSGAVHDLTHERELEQQLVQSQKMESLGTLAGGIAHDFNNILQAILGFNEIALENRGGDEEILVQCLEEIERGGGRATDLVNQILTFSRGTDIKLSPLSLPPLIRETLKFLRSTIPATIRIDSTIDDNCPQVEANATQIHQVLTNLSTNAMHAMEDSGGTLSVSLESVSLDASLETLSGVMEPGAFVQLRVADTGTGIAAEVLGQVLDPFFTTKEVGKGTGLGLSVVHGIVKSMRGGLTIESEVGKGTTLCILLPVLYEASKSRKSQVMEVTGELSSLYMDESKRVLIVDDEKSITDLTTLMLESRGYRVDAYNDVDRALEALQARPGDYDVAILDYTMPKKNGIELAEDILAVNPDIPVILATGVLDESKIKESPNIVEIIRKPFRAKSLLASIARCI